MVEKLRSAPKVLIVSNRPATGPLWMFALQQEHRNVVLEPNPSNALARWEKEIPDLIVLDLSLPFPATLECIKSLRAEMLIPILVLASGWSEGEVLEAYQAGIDDYVPK